MHFYSGYLLSLFCGDAKRILDPQMEARKEIIFMHNNEEMSQVKLTQRWKWKEYAQKVVGSHT